jgi:hypothetical protein
MAPEDDSARTPALYDHESDGPFARGRRSAADWGVNEDIFDRMPSRRFARADRRAEHAGEPRPRRFDRRVSGPSDAGRDGTGAGEPEARRQGALQEPPHGGGAARRVELWDADSERAAAWAAAERAPKRKVESWIVDEPASDGERRVESWLEPEQPVSRTIVIETGGGVEEPRDDEWTDADTAGAEAHDGARRAPRTIVLETSETDALALRPEGAGPRAGDDVAPVEGRRTVKISGHPDRLPAPRAARPPRTALDRIGTRPDRIVAYAVALGFLLVLIAVLTTGQ